MAKQYCRNVTSPRDGKTVYIGSDWKTVTSKQFNTEYTLRAGYEITERTIDKYGQFNLVPDIEVEAWWTNLGDPDEEIISLYHAHGECEQFHSEVKTDMDLERLPSGKPSFTHSYQQPDYDGRTYNHACTPVDNRPRKKQHLATYIF